MRGRGERAGDLAGTGDLGLGRGHADPVPLEDLLVARVVEGVGVLLGGGTEPPGLVEARLEVGGLAGRPPPGGGVALAGREVGEVAQPADRVDGVVELLLAHAAALDVAEPLGPAVLVGVELAEDVAHVADREGVEVVAEPVVAGPAPHEGDQARELRGLVGVARVAVRAEVDLAVRGDLVDDLAACAVRGEAHVAQRPQVVLDRGELAAGHGREAGVLTVGREQPGVVRPAGADPAGLGHGADGGGVRRAGVGDPDLQVPGLLHRVGEVLLAPGHALLEQPVAGQDHPRVPLYGGPLGALGAEQGGRVAQGGALRAAGRGDAVVGAGDGEPDRAAAGGDAEPVGQPTAGPLAVGRVVAAVGLGRRTGAGGRADHGALRAAVGAGHVGGGRGQRRADQGGVVVRLGVRHRRPALLAEQQAPAVDRGGVGQVVGRLAGLGLAPGVDLHQLGVRVDRERHGPRRGRRQPQPDHAGPEAVRGEVGAGDPDAVVGAEVHPGVAPAAGVLLRRQPRVAELEPQPVEELDRRRPEPAHLPAGVEAGRRVAAVLRAHLVEPVADHEAAPVGEPGGRGQLGGPERGRLRVVAGPFRRGAARRVDDRQREDQGGGQDGGSERRTTHVFFFPSGGCHM